MLIRVKQLSFGPVKRNKIEALHTSEPEHNTTSRAGRHGCLAPRLGINSDGVPLSGAAAYSRAVEEAGDGVGGSWWCI